MLSPQTKICTEDDYYAIPEDVRAELIDGQILYAPPTYRKHQEILSSLLVTIANYVDSKNNFCEIIPRPFAVELFSKGIKHIVEPDISVICDPSKLTDRGCSGAPDWIIEIVSPSNPSNDYIVKLNLYAASGVREYWIVDPQSQKVIVYNLGNEDFKMMTYNFKDKIKAGIYDDFEIDFAEFTV